MLSIMSKLILKYPKFFCKIGIHQVELEKTFGIFKVGSCIKCGKKGTFF